MEEARARGALHTLKDTVGIVVPLAVEMGARHAAGENLYVHPSSIILGDAGVSISPELAVRPPTLPRDKICMAPEEREGKPGNARASVYAIGAITYELLTGLTVGPGMRRPTEVVPTLPRALEVILAKSLVADPAHRPDDLNALAQALHNLAPAGSIAPPAADESHLDHDDRGFDVDVSLSMLPPAPSQIYNEAPSSPLDLAVAQAPGSAPRMSDSTSELAQLKARLERDKRPRYVVIKEGMDHGPFSSVELLQQIASHTFVEVDVLRDAFSKDERAIRDWEEFAPFAEHARLHRDIKAEKVALEKTVVAERKSTTSKALIGVAVIGALVAAAAVWLVARRGSKSDEIAVHGDTATNIEVDGGLKGAATRKLGGGSRGVVGVSNGIPILSGGMSCEGAIAAYKGDEVTIGGGPKVQADLTAGAYGAILNKGTYFAHCGAPDDMQINICAAVQNGRAVGVSVSVKPSNPGVASCIAGGVRGLSFPSRPNLDVTRTSF